MFSFILSQFSIIQLINHKLLTSQQCSLIHLLGLVRFDILCPLFSLICHGWSSSSRLLTSQQCPQTHFPCLAGLNIVSCVLFSHSFVTAGPVLTVGIGSLIVNTSQRIFTEGICWLRSLNTCVCAACIFNTTREKSDVLIYLSLKLLHLINQQFKTRYKLLKRLSFVS